MFVVLGNDGKSAVRALEKLQRAAGGNDRPPPVDAGLIDPDGARDRRLGPEISDSRGLEHGGRTYLKSNRQATHKQPGSGAQLPMPSGGSKRKADPVECGRRIKFLREARGLSQEGLARRLVELGAPSTITKSTVSKWETASTDPTKIEGVTIFYLLKILSTDAAFLFFGPNIDARADGSDEGQPPHQRRPNDHR